MVQTPNASNPLGFTPSVDLIGIEPPAYPTGHDRQSAEDFVTQLERVATFDQLVFRVFVVFEDPSTSRMKAAHAEVREGRLGPYFFPPAQDWPRTPLICAAGKALPMAAFPP